MLTVMACYTSIHPLFCNLALTLFGADNMNISAQLGVASTKLTFKVVLPHICSLHTRPAHYVPAI